MTAKEVSEQIYAEARDLTFGSYREMKKKGLSKPDCLTLLLNAFEIYERKVVEDGVSFSFHKWFKIERYVKRGNGFRFFKTVRKDNYRVNIFARSKKYRYVKSMNEYMREMFLEDCEKGLQEDLTYIAEARVIAKSEATLKRKAMEAEKENGGEKKKEDL